MPRQHKFEYFNVHISFFVGKAESNQLTPSKGERIKI